MEKMMLRKKSKINAAVVAGAANGSSGSKSKSVNGVSRKPLSDLSNLNLIPTDVLRKLCSNSISATDAQSLLRKYQAPGIKFPGNSNSSKSDTSIGSSNFNTIAKNNGRSTTRQLPRSSSAISVKSDEDCEPVLHSEKQNVINLEKYEKVSSDKGKSVCMPLRTTRASHAKSKQNIVMLGSCSTSFGKAIGEDTPIVSPSSVKPVQKMNDKAEVNLSEKAKDKGKETIVSRGSGSYDKTNDKGKAVVTPGCSLSEQTEDKGKSTAIGCSLTKIQKETPLAALNSTPVQKLNQKAGATAGSSKVSLSEKTKTTAVSFSAGTYDKTNDKGKAVAMPSRRLSKQEKGKGISSEMLASFAHTNEQKESKSVAVSASSCPRIRRKRNTRDDLSQGDLTPSRAWTDPHPKLKKRRCTPKATVSENSFPEEFIKQQKAYFKEVDDFELEVEEE